MSDRVGSFLIDKMMEQKKYYDMFFELYFERSQLYGVLINFMMEGNTKEMEITYDELRNASNFLLKFTPNNENNILKIELVDNPDKKEEVDE